MSQGKLAELLKVSQKQLVHGKLAELVQSLLKCNILRIFSLHQKKKFFMAFNCKNELEEVAKWKTKPKTIKANIDSGFLKTVHRNDCSAIKRKFNISIGIEGELFTKHWRCWGRNHYFRFLATDEVAQDIYSYIDENGSSPPTPKAFSLNSF